MAQSTTRTDRLRVGAAITLVFLEILVAFAILVLVLSWL